MCVLTSASVFVIHMYLMHYSGQRSNPCTIFQRFTSIIALKGKGRVHDPVRIHRLDRNGNRKPLIDWLWLVIKHVTKERLYSSLSTWRRFWIHMEFNSQFPWVACFCYSISRSLFPTSTFNQNLPLASTSGESRSLMRSQPEALKMQKSISGRSGKNWNTWDLESSFTKFSRIIRNPSQIYKWVSNSQKRSPSENAGKTEGPNCVTEGGTAS